MNHTGDISTEFLSGLGTILLKYDSDAIRLYDYLQNIQIFNYNTNKHSWETNSYIQGNLFCYEKRQDTNEQTCPCFAFLIINQYNSFKQEIPCDFRYKIQNCNFFYETIDANNQHQVYLIQFPNRYQCERYVAFINQSIDSLKMMKERNSRNTIRPVNSPHFKLLSITREVPISNQNEFQSEISDESDEGASNSLLTNRQYIYSILYGLIENNEEFIKKINQFY